MIPAPLQHRYNIPPHVPAQAARPHPRSNASETLLGVRYTSRREGEMDFRELVLQILAWELQRLGGAPTPWFAQHGTFALH